MRDSNPRKLSNSNTLAKCPDKPLWQSSEIVDLMGIEPISSTNCH